MGTTHSTGIMEKMKFALSFVWESPRMKSAGIWGFAGEIVSTKRNGSIGPRFDVLNSANASTRRKKSIGTDEVTDGGRNIAGIGPPNVAAILHAGGSRFR